MDRIIEMQVNLLGVYMNDQDVFSATQHLVSANIFTTPVLRKSYEVIKAYHARGIKPDNNIIYTQIVKAGISKSDAAIVASINPYALINESQIVEYVLILFEASIERHLRPILSNAIENMQLGSPLDEMTKIKDAITKIELVLNGVSRDKSSKDQFKEAVARIKGLRSGEIVQAGFSWGINELDKKTMGIVQGINVVAGDKGSGKTSLVINVIRKNAIENDIPVLFFSLEMTAVEVFTNLIANIKRINSRALRMGSVDEDDILSIEEIHSRLNDNFTIDETGGITWEYTESKIREFRRKNKIPYSQTILVILDYLQIMKNSPAESRMTKEQQLEQTCNELMRICKNENIAMVQLSQFSRESSKRASDTFKVKNDEDKRDALRPRMTDLKGTSAIESNAVTILLLFRPEYYQIYEAKGKNLRGLCEVNIAKGRYVNPEPMYVKFDGKYNLFEDLDGDIPEVESAIHTTGEDAF